METRKKLYYPASHIINNLKTAGKEWMLKDGTEYIGHYHSYIDGTYMTGPEYSAMESKTLIKYVNVIAQPDHFIYNKLKKKVVFKTPQYKFSLPTLEDYRDGKFLRHFISRRNKNTFEDIFEIDKEQFNKWATPGKGIDNYLYEVVSFDWKLTGPVFDVRKPSINEPDDRSKDNVVFGVHSTNERMVLLKDKILPGLKNYITDYIELSVHSKYVSDDIKKLFV